MYAEQTYLGTCIPKHLKMGVLPRRVILRLPFENIRFDIFVTLTAYPKSLSLHSAYFEQFRDHYIAVRSHLRTWLFSIHVDKCLSFKCP